MEKHELEQINRMSLESTRNRLDTTRQKIEKGMADLSDEVLAVFFKLLASGDEQIQAKMVTLYLDRVVPKIAVRSVEENAEIIESEAKKATRQEIEELLKRKKAG